MNHLPPQPGGSEVHLVAAAKWLHPVSDMLIAKGQRSWSNFTSREAFVVNVTKLSTALRISKASCVKYKKKLRPTIKSLHFLYLVLELSQEERQ